jgi:hypothetical protein
VKFNDLITLIKEDIEEDDIIAGMEEADNLLNYAKNTTAYVGSVDCCRSYWGTSWKKQSLLGALNFYNEPETLEVFAELSYDLPTNLLSAINKVMNGGMVIELEDNFIIIATDKETCKKLLLGIADWDEKSMKSHNFEILDEL